MAETPRVFSFSLVAFLLCPGFSLAQADATTGTDVPIAATEVGSETCATCHSDVAEAFSSTTHGRLVGELEKYRDKLCESCHGPGSAHAESGDASLILNPSKVEGDQSSKGCLGCHSGRDFMDWRFSVHAVGDVSCASCHSIHQASGSVLKTPSPGLCLGCHSEVRAAFTMPSHHPVMEGKLECQTCHTVHGGSATFVMGLDSREKCLTCHPDKEGPFVFEHEPVNEDCGVCHTHHGSVADNLLAQSEPALCLNCHSMHFHAAIVGWEKGDFTIPADPERHMTSNEDSFKESMLTRCTQCHSQIHGSDLPAQSISSQGRGLTR